MQFCNSSGLPKPFADFYRNRREKTGYSRTCKECQKKFQNKWLSENREKPNKPNINMFLVWGIIDLTIAFVGMFNGGGTIPIIFFAASLFQLTVGVVMVFKNVRFDELLEVIDDETE